MERESGHSYWAIRRQLDEVIAELGYDVEPEVNPLSGRRQEILEQLRNGEINVQEATRLLTQLGSHS
jgi:hypothetical protein